MADDDKTGQEPATEPGRLPDDVWQQLPDEARALIVSQTDATKDAAKYRVRLREAEQVIADVAEKFEVTPDKLYGGDWEPPEPPETVDVDEVRSEAAKAAADEWAPKVRDARVLAAAAGKLRHPSDALKLADLSDIDHDDQEAIDAAIDGLLDDRPDLAPSKPADLPPRGGSEPSGSKSWARNI